MTGDLLGVPWVAWGGVCLVVAGIYTVVRPRPRQPVSRRHGWRQPVLRWGHALVWLMLAASCFVRAADLAGVTDAANALALLVALLYAVFLATVVLDRNPGR